ncbi:MAG TPA: glycosyltransferase family 2 protein [Verrucomicrobiales bacterium]|nr:glycosyltransferase family 2 protein [Verrucomicrobiales bacterium]
MPERLPISLCMIAGTEAGQIGDSLAAVADWVAEMHVVINDTVADGTDEIARRHGATVHREPWKGHVAQKNSALNKATQPWVLGLDADEVVSAPLREEIFQLFAGLGGDELTGGPAAYSFPRCTMVCGRFLRHGDWYPDRQTRLWRRGRAKWAGENPHDKLAVDGSIGRLRNDLLHYGVPELNRQLAKIGPYTDDFVRQRLARGQNAGGLALLLRPWWTFIRGYFLRLGFLDGWQGYYVARMNAFTTLTRYVKLREARRRKPSN